MYRPNDIGILEAYDDFLRELTDNGETIDKDKIWLEAFKRGMRFNPDSSQSIPAQGAKIRCTCNSRGFYQSTRGCPIHGVKS